MAPVSISDRIQALGRTVGSFVGVVARQPVDIDLISATIHRGCMGLPQELVDHVIDMLHDDLPALKSCSLTCKAMFASTRHLIHKTLCLTPRNNKSVLTQEEKKRFRRLIHAPWYRDVQLRFLSYMGERGLLQYTRRIYIYTPRPVYIPDLGVFTPDTLLPHLHHFRSLNRVRALTIENYDADAWRHHCKSYFAHFYPTLTSLTLCHPLGHYQSYLQFALQFPNLEYLCLDWPDEGNEGVRPTRPAPPSVSTIFDQPSLIHGHLRLVNMDYAVRLPMNLAYDLRNGFKLRSVELEGTSLNLGQHVIDANANTIQDLTIISSGCKALRYIKLMGIKDLRRLTMHPRILTSSDIAFEFLPIHTITSNTLRELVLVVCRHCFCFDGLYWSRWTYIDGFLYERFAEHGDFRLVIKAGNLDGLCAFQGHVEEGFPLLASIGRVRFESFGLVDGCWDCSAPS